MDAGILTELKSMPIFEYVCQECDHQFEAIVLGQRKPACPKCESKKLRQRISSFAVGGDKSSSSRTAPNCGGGT